ncbi:hypothetical protein, partial [uncultured Rikenella sp.]|uniref:hypothetical protein n=1 Tax=uncultured Rikenella sp. TaxID=368003 RepID=UPI00262EAF8E
MEILLEQCAIVLTISFSCSRAQGTLIVARWDFISILLAAKRVKSLSKRAGGACRTPNWQPLPQPDG